MGKKARNNDGNIEVHNGVPSSFSSSKGTVIGGGQYLTDEQAQEHGWYNVEDIKTTHSDFDARIHDIGALSFDTDNNVYKYAKTNKTFSQSLAELKTQKIANLEHIYHRELEKTDWIVTKHLELGISVPQDIQDARKALRTECNNHESSINAKSTKNSVVLYDLPNFN